MKKVIADTNAFLRFLLNDVPSQKNKFEELLKLAKNSKITLIIPQILIFELDFILDKYYNFSKEEIVDKLWSIIGTPYLKVQDSDIFQDALLLYSKSNFSLVDCFLYSDVKKERAELFTFDKNLQKLLE